MKRQKLKNLIAAIATITIFGFTLGLLFPLLSLTMQAEGIPEKIIGWINASTSFGIVGALFCTPPLVRRFGAKATAITMAVIACQLVLAYSYVPILWGWLFLRIAHGLTISILFSISESLVVKFAEGPYRGRILALYTSILSLSFGAGPALISLTGIDTLLPYIIGAAIVAAAIIPLFLIKDANVDEQAEAPLSILSFGRKAPALLLGVVLFAVIDGAYLSFLPVYGVLRGESEAWAALSLSFFSFGNVFLLFPMGWLADHMNKRLLLLICVVVTGLASALLPVTFGSWFYHVQVMIIGTVSCSIYMLCLSLLGDHFSGHDLVTGTASFSTCWGFGAFLGTFTSGYAMQDYGPNGFPYAMALVYLIGFGLLLILPTTSTVKKHDKLQSR